MRQTKSSGCVYAIVSISGIELPTRWWRDPAILWLKIVVKLRVRSKERLTVDSPILVRVNRNKVVPMTGAYMMRMDKIYAPILG